MAQQRTSAAARGSLYASNKASLYGHKKFGLRKVKPGVLRQAAEALASKTDPFIRMHLAVICIAIFTRG